ncbi:hypothetical protein ABT324_15325 [Saccharopolyspora sp. NPDC000359]|uniref:hypothetical protein n=1 Tax=Saccharopolyspora sp. NPDC000359 TaxID=3154251 RepID=UPI003326DC69
MPKKDDEFAHDIEDFNARLSESVHYYAQIDNFVWETRKSGIETAADYLQKIRDVGTTVEGFGQISGGTEVATHFIEDQARNALQKHDIHLHNRPTQEIKGILQYWNGPWGSAASNFHNSYLNSLDHALYDEYLILSYMSAAIKSCEAIIDQARQKYLDILGSAMSKLTGGGPDQRSSAADRADTMINSIATGVTIGSAGGAEGAAWGALAGALYGCGKLIAEGMSDPEGENWVTILDGTLANRNTIEPAVRHEMQSIEKFLQDVALHAHYSIALPSPTSNV